MPLLNKNFILGLESLGIDKNLVAKTVLKYNTTDAIRKLGVFLFWILTPIAAFSGLTALIEIYWMGFIGFIVMGVITPIALISFPLVIIALRQKYILNELEKMDGGETVFLREYIDGNVMSFFDYNLKKVYVEKKQLSQDKSITDKEVSQKPEEGKESIQREKNKMEVSQNEQNAERKSASKFNAIRARSEHLLESMKMFPCSNNSNKELKQFDEWDAQEGCKGPAVYVCHHCKTSLCSTHSYWIPDHEFPYLMKAGLRPPIVDNSAQLRSEAQSKIIMAIVLFVIGFSINFTTYGNIVGPLMVLSAGSIVIKGIEQLMNAQEQPPAPNPYPEYVDSFSTKWGNVIDKNYALMGNYTAVHCWNCLNGHHPDFIQISRNVFSMVYSESRNWKKRTEVGILGYSESDRIKAGNMAANTYLTDFKFASSILVPTNGGFLKKMIRPDDYMVKLNEGEIKTVKYVSQDQQVVESWRHYMPTPVWLDEPNVTKVYRDDEKRWKMTSITLLIMAAVMLIGTIISTIIIHANIEELAYMGLAVSIAIILTLIFQSIKFSKFEQQAEEIENTVPKWFDRYRSYVKWMLRSS